MPRTHRIRFVPGLKRNPPPAPESPDSMGEPTLTPQSRSESSSPKMSRSKHSCKECKQRRVKCDEAYPVCLRCQRRGSVCLSASPPTQWQAEMPWVISKPMQELGTGAVAPNKRLLQYWLEKTSRIMTVRPENNPLSFPLLQYLMSTPSLLHAVQSVSAGQEQFFQSSNLGPCLTQRGMAIQALRHEIQDPARIKPSSILAVFLQGVSWTWTEDHPCDYGKQHLRGARVLLENMLVDKEKRQDPLVQFMLGWYLYWDMSCAFIADRYDLSPLNTQQLFDAIQDARDSFHPMVGFNAQLFYLIACVGRHCRLVMDTGARDPSLEATFEEQLLAWDPQHEDKTLVDMSIAYRNHGLIMLYQICGNPRLASSPTELSQRPDAADQMVSAEESVNATIDENTHAHIQDLVVDTLRRLFDTPIDAACFSFHSIPLLTAAAELPREQLHDRSTVVYRFKALYSTNRVAVNMWAIELLEELWDLHDCGIHISWLELLKTKDWTLSFA
ncbi:hypothetical protein FOZG_17882 [Fusarium oxysporum Fo47]|uniref:Uncharacterized protein n=1 Tax=Fusarium oxysporum Fo47 TaxID=660027 RepID=W9J8N4_FUSOX|nr:hypothetical protein FOZG_17882 [Fusarium oxysporum Fo47]